MVGWHHRLDGHEFEQAPGDGEGQGNQACCSSWGCRARHNLATEQQYMLGCTFKVNLTSLHVPQKKRKVHHLFLNGRNLELPRQCDFPVTQTAVGFPGGSDGKEPACNVGDPGSIPGSGRSPGEGNGNKLQYSCLENPMDRESWWATVHGVAKSH